MISTFDEIKKIIKEWTLPVIFYGIIAFFVLKFFFSSFFNFYKTQIAKNWIPVIAEVTLVSVNSERSYSSVYEKYVCNINAVTEYSYKINNKIIFGNKIAFGYDEESFNDDVDTEIFNKLKKCKLVMVYVNPNNENESVIAPGINGSIFINLIITLMWCTLISLFIIPASLKQISKLKLFFKIYYFAILVLWIIGIFPFLTKSILPNLKDNIKIIEEKVTNKFY